MVNVPPDIARLGVQADQMRKRIAAQMVAQQRQKALQAAQAQQQQLMQQAMQASQGAPQAQVDPFEAMQQQAQEERRRQAVLDALQDQKGGA